MHDLLTGWLSFLKDPAFMDNSFFKDVHVQAAMETLQYVSADNITRQVYEARLKTLNDHNSEMTTARQQGLEEGLEKGIEVGEKIGLEKGAQPKAIETARNFLEIGLSVEQVTQGTGLSIEEVERLR